MVEARFVRIEGLERTPCLFVPQGHDVPEELIIDFGAGDRHPEAGKHGRVTYRLQPSTSHDEEPVYVEIFDE